MRLSTTAAATARLALTGVLAASLGACGGSASKSPAAQKSIAGCGIPASRGSEELIQQAVTAGFRAEHAVTDPKKLNELEDLYAHDFEAGFAKWYGMVEDNPSFTVRGMTMSRWELYFKVTEFSHQADIYPAICGGWTFESYLQKHPDVDKSAVDAAIAGSKPTHT